MIYKSKNTTFKLSKFYADGDVAAQINFGEISNSEMSELYALHQTGQIGVFLVPLEMMDYVEEVFSEIENMKNGA